MPNNTGNHRLAAAFQDGKDPQQDAIISWLDSLPKDTRGGVKRSVMKYHLTRALIMYIQSGHDKSVQLLNNLPAKHVVTVSDTSSKTEDVKIPSVVPVTDTTSIESVSKSFDDIPTLKDTVKKTNLRSRIANSMRPT